MSHGFAGVGQDRTNGGYVRVCPAGLDDDMTAYIFVPGVLKLKQPALYI